MKCRGETVNWKEQGEPTMTTTREGKVIILGSEFIYIYNQFNTRYFFTVF